jgi:two-component system sensor histidine kinase BaeS
MVGIAFGVLVVAALGAAGLARETAKDAAVKDLRAQAPSIGAELEDLGTRFRRARRTAENLNPNQAATRRTNLLFACRLIGSTVKLSGGSVVVVAEDGSVEDGVGGLLGEACASRAPVPELPRELELDDLDATRLARGEVQTGDRGSTAFVAQPLTPVAGRTPVLVLTQQVETRPLGRAGGYLLGTGAFALFVAAVVAAILARRLTRPIAAMQTTAGRIASGDLSARVDTTAMPDDELASLARSIDTMAEELESAQGHERAFLLSISHDLRTPLTSIKGYAEAMSDGTIDSDPERVRAARVIMSESQRLERLVADLLDLARLDARQFSLAPRAVDAAAVVRATVEGFLPSARDWDIRLEVGAGAAIDATIDATVDPERLGQVVANLLENALKYARLAVTVDVTATESHLVVRVDDDGPGIPDEERDRVFERLYTARGTPSRSLGTGIGLAIVHELAGAMGGSASCEPLPEGGTRFLVTVPRVPPAPPEP